MLAGLDDGRPQPGQPSVLRGGHAGTLFDQVGQNLVDRQHHRGISFRDVAKCRNIIQDLKGLSKIAQSLDLLDRSSLPHQFARRGKRTPRCDEEQIIQGITALTLEGLRPPPRFIVRAGAQHRRQLRACRRQTFQVDLRGRQRSWRMLQFTLQPLQQNHDFRWRCTRT